MLGTTTDIDESAVIVLIPPLRYTSLMPKFGKKLAG